MTTIRELPVNGRLELDDRRRRVNGHPRPTAIDGMLDASSALVNLRLSTRSDGTGLAARGLAHGGFEFIGPKPERLSIRTAKRALVGDDSRSDERACTRSVSDRITAGMPGCPSTRESGSVRVISRARRSRLGTDGGGAGRLLCLPSFANVSALDDVRAAERRLTELARANTLAERYRQPEA